MRFSCATGSTKSPIARQKMQRSEDSMSDDSIIRKILKRDRAIAVVGLSDKPHRPSHGVAEAMQPAGCRIVPVNPAPDGRRHFSHLSEIARNSPFASARCSH
ncbi:CoA-binding protein [Burkholderia ubonensis]|uniref:CoA-binding protein n=2 Tax=Burkholderia ubonensis TaxID=101571 RepID=UPI0039F485F3